MRTLICLFLLAGAASADDTSLYESLDGVKIGRVFLSPERRLQLDANRGKTQAAAPGRSQSSVARKPVNDDAVGYIISGAGKSRVWKGGEFRAAETQQVDSLTFPSAIRVHKSEPDGDDETEVKDRQQADDSRP